MELEVVCLLQGPITVTPTNTANCSINTNIVYQYCINRYYPCNNWSNGNRNGYRITSRVTAAFASNTITISGTPTVSGTFNYSIPLTGGCGAVNATGTITVTPNNTASAASTTPTLCISTVLTDITCNNWSNGNRNGYRITSRSYRSICFEYHYN
jgi:hypothetical protein